MSFCVSKVRFGLSNLTLDTQNDIRSIPIRVEVANETKSLSDQSYLHQVFSPMGANSDNVAEMYKICLYINRTYVHKCDFLLKMRSFWHYFFENYLQIA